MDFKKIIKIFMIGVPSPQVNFSVNALETHNGEQEAKQKMRQKKTDFIKSIK